MSDAAAGQTIAGLERALEVLVFFAETPARTLGVTEIAQGLDLSKAVVHRILASFRAKGFVEFDEETRRYSLGPRLLFLGLTYLDRIDLRGVTRQAMIDLCDATGETATLSVRSGGTRVYIDQVTPLRDVKMVVQLGTPWPLHAGASSKAFLAFLPDADREAYLSKPLERLTADTVVDLKALRKELADIRERGFAVSFGERQSGAGAVAAPIFGYDQMPLAVISVAGPIDRFRSEADQAATLLLEHTAKASERMGHRAEAAAS